jgi:hypothetical protein
MLALLALTCAALFTGAAVYISIAEHPARLRLPDSAALAQWQPSYKAAVPMQAGLAVASALLGLIAWINRGDFCLLLGALLIGAVIPLTIFGIMPTNKKMMAMDPATAGPEARRLLVRWGGLHWMRNALGAASILAFLACLA